MKTFFLIGVIMISMFAQAYAQVGINTDNSPPDGSAMLDVKSTVKGILMPRMTAAQRAAIVSPTSGLMVYQTNGQSGYYYYTGTGWTLLINDNSFYMPVGSVMIWPGNIAPSGWLLCDGQAASRTYYADLFTVIGSQYGAGDGTSTFNLPDLKGRSPVGLDLSQADFDVLGETGGEKQHTLSTAEMPSHFHSVNPPSTATGSGGASHTHTVDPPSATTGTDGNHRHENDADYASGLGSASSGDKVTYNNDGSSTSDYCDYDGDHSHTLNIGSFSSGSAGAHTHSINIGAFNSGTTGGATAMNLLQPYLVLNFIIKY
jgi:microcystin-dependent protein